MVEVICDTSFLIHIATNRITNIDNLDCEIGPLTFVIPEVVINELSKLGEKDEKMKQISCTMNYIKKFKIIPLNGIFADKVILDYISKNRTIVATMDIELKNKIKSFKSSVLSIHNQKIILEN